MIDNIFFIKKALLPVLLTACMALTANADDNNKLFISTSKARVMAMGGVYTAVSNSA